MYFFGVIYISTAILVFIFKNEKSKQNIQDEDEAAQSQNKRLNLYESYQIIWKLFSLKSVRELTIILLTLNVR